jgi:hypothetical protein
MTVWGDFEGEMERLPLDTDTADRLLAGDVPRQDAPPGYGDVVSLLGSLRAGQAGAISWDEGDVAALLTGLHPPPPADTRSPGRSKMHRLTLTGAALAAAFACTTALAFAGSLPGAAQDVASAVLAKAGVSVPGPDENAGIHPTVRGTSSPDATPARATDTRGRPAESASEEGGHGKGAEISQLATQTDLTGVDKGAAISTAASGGRSQAGQHGQSSSGGSSAQRGTNPGAATADAASGGHSSVGSDNAATGTSHRP